MSQSLSSNSRILPPQECSPRIQPLQHLMALLNPLQALSFSLHRTVIFFKSQLPSLYMNQGP